MLAVEVLTAARGIEVRAPLSPTPATAAVIGAIREKVAGPGTDGHLSPEVGAVVHMAAAGELVAAAY